MDERYNGSPKEASTNAVWTRRDVWSNFNHNKNKERGLKQQNADSGKNQAKYETEREAINVIATAEAKLDEDDQLRKNVWSDVDDELYIANLIKHRTTDVKRNKRGVSGSDISEQVVNSVSLDNSAMWELEPTDLTECDCLGPPPEFLLPPPPRPPFLQSEYYCGDDPIPDLETCDTEPKIDAYNHNGSSLQTSAVIGLCSFVLAACVLIGIILVWKHKRKVTNLLPSKSSAPSQSSGSQRRAPPPAPLYEDLQDLPRRPPLPHRPQELEPQLEMVETRRPNCTGRVFVCGSGNTWRGGNSCGGETCGAPLYEELPHRSDDSVHSDDHFAEDELSLVGEAAPCRTCSRPQAPQSLQHRPRHQRLDRRPKSLERRRAQHRIPRHMHPPDPSEFHEGVLLDALLRLYPQVGTVGARPGPVPVGAGGAWPGGELPGIQCWRGPRASPKPPSGDSSFGSDSGYSNNTCGTCGTRASSRHRLSAEMPMS
ncbi:uncharacterized protein LOC101740264 [Bombyx mori]|uniref:Uncharacterized protein n=1 Tax=Bombyx mori TaxID=7091 RepID=A0A8R2DQQ6_BOMMO|nr:uncharacterized protein LOC101740264 [Bombyx mori]XP_021209257.1 uncharacterized protein LOC101740264 [Bombyx mori]XP_037876320.1 uncharacterized protein LOC101740264 [Bombyx mori]